MMIRLWDVWHLKISHSCSRYKTSLRRGSVYKILSFGCNSLYLLLRVLQENCSDKLTGPILAETMLAVELFWFEFLSFFRIAFWMDCTKQMMKHTVNKDFAECGPLTKHCLHGPTGAGNYCTFTFHVRLPTKYVTRDTRRFRYYSEALWINLWSLIKTKINRKKNTQHSNELTLKGIYKIRAFLLYVWLIWVYLLMMEPEGINYIQQSTLYTKRAYKMRTQKQSSIIP